jgi:hypothetical protein
VVWQGSAGDRRPYADQVVSALSGVPRTEISQNENHADRGTFDRGDLKEAAGGASRAMEPRVCFLGFEARCLGRWTGREAGKAAISTSKETGALRKGHSGLNGREAESKLASSRNTTAPAPKGT